MATTNKAIIDAYKVSHGLSLDTPLYTWAVWHNMGYRVRKGEKCKHRVTLWKHTERKIEQDGQEKTVGKCFHKVANLFEMSQVESMG